MHRFVSSPSTILSLNEGNCLLVMSVAGEDQPFSLSLGLRTGREFTRGLSLQCHHTPEELPVIGHSLRVCAVNNVVCFIGFH